MKTKTKEEIIAKIIKLRAKLKLPKGTELFLSDIHGESDFFSHILCTGSGIIKRKIDDIYKTLLTENEKKTLGTLIYYPEEKLEIIKESIKKSNKNEKQYKAKIHTWYFKTIVQLIKVLKEVSAKYDTETMLENITNKGIKSIITELLYIEKSSKNKQKYNAEILNNIIYLDVADEIIISIAKIIKKMSIARLHVIGDIYDRGKNSYKVMETIKKYHSVDIEWGNHDIIWMGAAALNDACIMNVIANSIKYNTFETLVKYNINIVPLLSYSEKIYSNDFCNEMLEKQVNAKICDKYKINKTTTISKESYLKLKKLVYVILLKLDGIIIKNHPEYHMEDRLLFEKMNLKNSIIKLKTNKNNIGYIKTSLKTNKFPTIDIQEPYKLTKDEENVVRYLHNQFKNSKSLQSHMKFLFYKGDSYKIYNGNLLFHACIPLDEDGNLREFYAINENLKGKLLYDKLNIIIKRAYFCNIELKNNNIFNEEEIKELKENEDLNLNYGKFKSSNNYQDEQDYLWFLLKGPHSPLVGKDNIKLFEKIFVYDLKNAKVRNNPYFSLANKEEICTMILKEFGLYNKNAKIINGHTPVYDKKGDTPIKAKGKRIIIDRGIVADDNETDVSKAGFILIYNSYGLILATNEVFKTKADAIRTEATVKYDFMLNEKSNTRITIEETNEGKEIINEINELQSELKEYDNKI